MNMRKYIKNYKILTLSAICLLGNGNTIRSTEEAITEPIADSVAQASAEASSGLASALANYLPSSQTVSELSARLQPSAETLQKLQESLQDYTPNADTFNRILRSLEGLTPQQQSAIIAALVIGSGAALYSWRSSAQKQETTLNLLNFFSGNMPENIDYDKLQNELSFILSKKFDQSSDNAKNIYFKLLEEYVKNYNSALLRNLIIPTIISDTDFLENTPTDLTKAFNSKIKEAKDSKTKKLLECYFYLQDVNQATTNITAEKSKVAYSLFRSTNWVFWNSQEKNDLDTLLNASRDMNSKEKALGRMRARIIMQFPTDIQWLIVQDYIMQKEPFTPFELPEYLKRDVNYTKATSAAKRIPIASAAAKVTESIKPNESDESNKPDADRRSASESRETLRADAISTDMKAPNKELSTEKEEAHVEDTEPEKPEAPAESKPEEQKKSSSLWDIVTSFVV